MTYWADGRTRHSSDCKGQIYSRHFQPDTFKTLLKAHATSLQVASLDSFVLEPCVLCALLQISLWVSSSIHPSRTRPLGSVCVGLGSELSLEIIFCCVVLICSFHLEDLAHWVL